mgnify:CR=1 FL=1
MGKLRTSRCRCAAGRLLKTSASPKVGTSEPTITAKLPGYGAVGMLWSQIWQKPVVLPADQVERSLGGARGGKPPRPMAATAERAKMRRIKFSGSEIRGFDAPAWCGAIVREGFKACRTRKSSPTAAPPCWKGAAAPRIDPPKCLEGHPAGNSAHGNSAVRSRRG